LGSFHEDRSVAILIEMFARGVSEHHPILGSFHEEPRLSFPVGTFFAEAAAPV
jgi:hypothetical protein